MSTDFVMIETSATIDESGGMDLDHPVNRTRCQAPLGPSHPVRYAARSLGFEFGEFDLRCKKRARHWHGGEALCTQHWNMVAEDDSGGGAS